MVFTPGDIIPGTVHEEFLTHGLRGETISLRLTAGASVICDICDICGYMPFLRYGCA